MPIKPEDARKAYYAQTDITRYFDKIDRLLSAKFSDRPIDIITWDCPPRMIHEQALRIARAYNEVGWVAEVSSGHLGGMCITFSLPNRLDPLS